MRRSGDGRTQPDARGLAATFLFGRVRGLKDAEHLPDLGVFLERVPQWQIGVEAVAIPSPFLRPLQVSRVDQVSDYSLGRALGYPDPFCHIPMANARIAGDAKKYMRMVRQERPPRHDHTIPHAQITILKT